MPKLKNLDNIDNLNNPSLQRADSLLNHEEATGKDAGINAGIDQLQAYANDPNNASSEPSLSSAAKTAEESNNGFWAGKDQDNAEESRSQPGRRFTFKGAITGKRAASGGIIGAILALVGAISFIATPGLAAVQMKEILTDDLNDQLGAMDVRSVYVMRGKLNDMGKGVCTGIKIRCGFKGMSDRQIKKFEKAGFTIETDGKVLGRNHVVSLSVKDSKGNTITVDNPRALNRALGDKMVRKALKKAFNPKFAGFYDATWDKFKQKFHLTSSDKLGTGSTEEKERAVTSAVQGEPIGIDGADKVATTDADGNPIADADKTNAEVDRVNGAIDAGGVSTTSVLGSAGTGAIKGIGVLGAADAACTVKNTARAVEAGAKLYRYRQLMAYAMVFLTFADSVKAGTATPDQAEHVGNTLTAIDTDKKIVDENSKILDDDGDDVEEVENPYYGANAFDSAGYKASLYNDAPTLSARDMQMAIGGGVALSMLAKVNKFLGDSGADNCKLVQNWAVRGGSLLAGIALGVVTLGWGTAISVGASVGISMALPILENYLAQMTAGTVANGETKGVDAGNAIFAGSAALMGGMAMSRGMKPATKSDLKTYLALNDEVKAEYVAIETEEARATPFDVNNRYSFMGSIARSLLPAQTTSSISIGNSLLNTLSTLSSKLTLTSKTFAQSAYNEDRYSKCEDNGYNELGIDADVFCNVRYTMSPYELSLNSEDVRVQMLEWGQVNDDEEGTVVEGSDYDKWLEECVEREQGWGETEAENQEDGDGMRCMGTSQTDSFYRVYTMDASIIAAMDYEGPVVENTFEDTGEGLNLRVATFNAGGDIKTDDSSVDRMANTLKEHQPDVVGFQEFNPGWRSAALDENMVEINYETYPKSSGTIKGTDPLVNAILYNADKFDAIEAESGIMPNLKYFNGDELNAPYVLLEERVTGARVYVLNTHDPAKHENADLRLANAKQHVEFIKGLGTEIPIVFTGDFNSGYSLRYERNTTVGNNPENLAYCILTKSTSLNDAYDVANNRSKKCPNPGNDNSVDHIFLSQGIGVSKYFRAYAGDVHDSHFADITIGSSEVNWPVDIGFWKADRADFVGAHTADSGTWTNRINRLAADIGSPPEGSAVYAMLGGTVSRADLGGHGLAIESKVSGGKVEIAYAHGPRENNKTSYKAGDKIMEVGCLGNCEGAHLHIDISFTPTGGARRGVCPQDVFLALDRGDAINWAVLSEKANAPCGRS